LAIQIPLMASERRKIENITTTFRHFFNFDLHSPHFASKPIYLDTHYNLSMISMSGVRCRVCFFEENAKNAAIPPIAPTTPKLSNTFVTPLREDLDPLDEDLSAIVNGQ
jgi:hypothetical protein